MLVPRNQRNVHIHSPNSFTKWNAVTLRLLFNNQPDPIAFHWWQGEDTDRTWLLWAYAVNTIQSLVVWLVELTVSTHINWGGQWKKWGREGEAQGNFWIGLGKVEQGHVQWCTCGRILSLSSCLSCASRIAMETFLRARQQKVHLPEEIPPAAPHPKI